MGNCDNYDKWQAQEDVFALKRAEEIKNDPQRLQKLKDFIDKEHKDMMKVTKSIPQNTGRGNKATIGKLKYK